MHTMYVDDYGCIDITSLVHLCRVDPCEAHPEDSEWLIGCLLYVANQAIHCSLAYPTRTYRDAACDALVALHHRHGALMALEEDEP